MSYQASTRPPYLQKLVAYNLEYALSIGHDWGMKQSDMALKSHRVTVRMTGPMLANLRRLAGTDRRIGEEIRNAIRLYLDDKGQITGSRRYFTGVFRDEVRLLRRELSWHLTLITLLLAEMLSILIRNSLGLDEQAAKSFTPSGILKIAEERLVESGWKVRMRIDAATDDAELEEQRQKDKVS
jgi:hypothetical protein